MLKKLKNNNTGAIAISRVICYLFLIMFIAFTLDLLIVMTQNVVTSYEAAYYAEKISIQGGLLGEEMRYPSINEVRGTTNACGAYQKACTSCLTNADIIKRISKTMGYFGVRDNEWGASFETEGKEAKFQEKGAVGDGSSIRLVSNYMNTGTFKLSTDWKPKFAKFIFAVGGKTTYPIDKHVPIIMEYIPQTDWNDSTCIYWRG